MGKSNSYSLSLCIRWKSEKCKKENLSNQVNCLPILTETGNLIEYARILLCKSSVSSSDLPEGHLTDNMY